jgi:hypothetical protein
MNQPAPAAAVAPAAPAGVQVLELPAPTYPLTNQVVARNPFPQEGKGSNQPIVWRVGQPHPFVKDFRIVRMYILPGVGVEAYAGKPGDSSVAVRNTIPWHCVELTEEVMDAATFVDEIVDAERDGEDPEPEPTGANGGNGAA